MNKQILRAIIIDDETKCRSVLEKQLSFACPNVDVLASLGEPQAAVSVVRDLSPDILFLDIEMPLMNGFEFLQELDRIDIDVIFTTAHEEYALKAFQVYAVAYLLKPCTEEDLVKAIDKVIDKRIAPLDQSTILKLFESIQKTGQTQKVAIPTMEGYEFVLRDQIVRCESSGNYTKIHLRDKPAILVSKTLKIVGELLGDSNLFVRAHAAHIVNLNYVVKYLKGAGGQLVMEDGAIIPVSKSKKSGLLESL